MPIPQTLIAHEPYTLYPTHSRRPHVCPAMEETEPEFVLNEEELCREEDDHLTRLHPWWKFDRTQQTFGGFQEHNIESAYRRWHHKMWLPRIRIMFVMGTIVFSGGFVFQQIVRPGSMRTMIMRIQEASPVAAIIARVIAPIWALILYRPPLRKHVTPDRYQFFVASAFVLAFAFEYASAAVGTHPYLAPPPERTPLNAKAWVDVDAWASDPRIVSRHTFWHAVISDAMLISISALSGLRPHIVLLLAILLTVVSQLQFQVSYVSLDMLRVGSNGTATGTAAFRILWVYRALPLLMMVSISYVLERGQRAEFRFRLMLMMQRDLRIEQLTKEKEHLDWDRKMAQKLVHQGAPRQGMRDGEPVPPTPPHPCHAPHSVSGSTGASCSEIEGIGMTAYNSEYHARQSAGSSSDVVASGLALRADLIGPLASVEMSRRWNRSRSESAASLR